MLMAAMFVASTTISMMNAKKQSKAAEKQARHQQMLLNMKADEMARRSAENLALFEVQARGQVDQLEGKMTGGRYGRLGEASRANQVDSAYSTMFSQMEMQKRRDDWDIKMTRMGADAAGDQAADAKKAGYWNMLSAGVQAGTQGAMMYKQGLFDTKAPVGKTAPVR